MRPAISDLPSQTPRSAPAAGAMQQPDWPGGVPPSEPRNFVVMVLYQVVMRMGWIFKTESIIMPAVLDSIGGAGWLRGCLPLLNRFGQSVPPLMMARRIKVMPRKKWAMTICTFLMALSFLSLSAIWFVTGGTATWWMPVVFLSFYAGFFMSTGVNQLSFGTLQGKLIRATRRGRLLLTANVTGAVCSITCALCLLPLWLRPDGEDFGLIFGFAGTCFAISAVASTLLAERADNYVQPARPVGELFAAAAKTVRRDPNFRRLTVVGALFGVSMMLFPHYQALGLRKFGLTLDSLIWWIIVQNAGTALFSFPAGWLADRYGTRLVLRIAMLAICGAPVTAVLLGHVGQAGGSMYYLVFLLVGLTPVTIKTLNNYTLEICEPADHPRYLSTLSLCAAAPMFLAPLVGLLIDAVGFEAVFLGGAALVLIGWLLTFGLSEPRHRVSEAPAEAAVADE